MLSVQEAFNILGLSSDASLKEIRKAYLALVRSWHPDRHPHNARLQHLAEERLKEINAAYQIARKNVGNVPSLIDSPFRFTSPATDNGGEPASATPPVMKQPQQVLLRPKKIPALQNFLLGSLGLATAWVSFDAYGFTTDALLYFLLIMTIPVVCGMICNSAIGTPRLRFAYVTSILLAAAAIVYHQLSIRTVSAVPSITKGEDETVQGSGSAPSVTGGRGGYTLEPVHRDAERGVQPPSTPSTPSAPEMTAPQPPSAPIAPLRR